MQYQNKKIWFCVPRQGLAKDKGLHIYIDTACIMKYGDIWKFNTPRKKTILSDHILILTTSQIHYAWIFKEKIILIAIDLMSDYFPAESPVLENN